MGRGSLVPFVAVFVSLACGSGGSSDDGDSGLDSGGGSGGTTSSNGGTATNGGTTSGTGTGGLGGTSAGTDFGGAPAGGNAGTAGATTGGQSGSSSGGSAGAGTSGTAGTGGTGGMTEWVCQTSNDGCVCGPVIAPNADDCGADWECCIYYVTTIDEVEYEVCACDATADADCTERAGSLFHGRRETSCPP